jgi:carbon monoxide dehydrogenase subunit G
MHLEGTQIINAPREKVWQFITDPNLVSQCAPGVKSVDVIEPNQKVRAVAAVGLGAIKATFTIIVTYATLNAPELANFRATATAPGSEARITSFVALNSTSEGQTELSWGADITMFGTIATLAERLIPSVSKQLTSEFFACVKKKLEA